MPNFKERFRERFVRKDDGLLNIGKYDEEDILAFIEEEIVGAKSHSLIDGIRRGTAEERQRIVEILEGMTRRDCDSADHNCTSGFCQEERGYNQALDEAISKIRPQPGIQEETECCKYCLSGDCFGVNCPCHTQTVTVAPIYPPTLKPRTEDNYHWEKCGLDRDHKGYCQLEETEKESASFSGSGTAWPCGWPGTPRYCQHEQCRPKESPTPQSREQGGEVFGWRIKSDSSLPHDELILESPKQTVRFKVVRETNQ